jgi:hypothetical protein
MRKSKFPAIFAIPYDTTRGEVISPFSYLKAVIITAIVIKTLRSFSLLA